VKIKPQSYRLIPKEKTAFFKTIGRRVCKREPAQKKPPVFIGLGAVLQQEFFTLFSGTEIPVSQG
jgi:hypothetical protein